MRTSKSVTRNRYLMNDAGIYRFRGGDWRSDWHAAKAAGRTLPSARNYHAIYGGNNTWAKVNLR